MSPGQRQSSETFKKVIEGYSAIGRPIKADYETQLRIELANGSRILCMPGVEETVRCYSPNLIIIDEAARVPDDLYRAIRPMLAVSHGRLVVFSTPLGQRGWFYDEWQGNGPFHKTRVTWHDCPRITAVFFAEEERALGRSWVSSSEMLLLTLRVPVHVMLMCQDILPQLGQGARSSNGRFAG